MDNKKTLAWKILSNIQDLITTAEMTNHAPKTNGYNQAPLSPSLIKSHGRRGNQAKEVEQIWRRQATRAHQHSRQQHHPLSRHWQP